MIGGSMPGAGTRLNGRPAGFRAYKWRDPARVSRERLAALAAHDQRVARLSGGVTTGGQKHVSTEESAQLRAGYAASRRAGASVRESAKAVSVSARTGELYESCRRDEARARDIPANCECTWNWDGVTGRWERAARVSRTCDWHARSRRHTKKKEEASL